MTRHWEMDDDARKRLYQARKLLREISKWPPEFGDLAVRQSVLGGGSLTLFESADIVREMMNDA